MTAKAARTILPYAIGRALADNPDDAEAIAVAAGALDKQIAEPPKNIRRYLTVDIAACPECGAYVANTMKYCADCGQCLEWEAKQ